MRTPDETRSAMKRLAAKRDERSKAKGGCDSRWWEYVAWVEALEWQLGDDNGTVAQALHHLPVKESADDLFRQQK